MSSLPVDDDDDDDYDERTMFPVSQAMMSLDVPSSSSLDAYSSPNDFSVAMIRLRVMFRIVMIVPRSPVL